jgi:Na+/H+ antiporter NhaC
MSDETTTAIPEFGTADNSDPAIEFYGGRLVSALPIALFVCWAVFQSGVLGIGDTTGLVAGMFVSLTVGLLFVKGDWKAYADVIFEGMTQRVAATAIVAWLWAGVFANTIQAGGFVGGLVWAADTFSVGAALFPVVTFLLAGLLATGIGTGYGTTVAFSALFFPAGVALGADPVLLFGSILSGAVFGDNLAPVSDTTIVSAVTQDSDIGGVVASRFKYAIVAAVGAIVAYLVAGAALAGDPVSGASGLLSDQANVFGLLHVLSMLTVVALAVSGRHIIEAISWGLIVAVSFNLLAGLAPVREMLVFYAPDNPVSQSLSVLPFVVIPENADLVGSVGGSIYTGAAGFFPLIVLVLLIVAGSQIMIRGGGFEAVQAFLLERVATSVRRGELTMVLGTAMVNAMVTINTAAEIAIAPYVARIGKRFNINGYRRANILDANTSALGYIFPWAGGVLVGYAQLRQLPETFDWFTEAMVVTPIQVWPFVFHGWLLFGVFLVAAVTGYGLEYTTDRESSEVSRV